MDARIINALIGAVIKNFEAFMGKKPELGKPQLIKDLKPRFDMITVIGFTGDCQGNVLYSFSPKTSLNIVSKMMGMPYESLDELALSAIGELGNMISGALAMNLEKLGLKIVISPPTIVTGDHLKISADGMALELLVNSFSKEDVQIILSLKSS